MAELIPPTLSSRASKGEERLHQLFKRLPEGEVVFGGQDAGNGGGPSFVGLSPDAGLWFVEVVSWTRGAIRFGDHRSISLVRDGVESYVDHPLAAIRRQIGKLARTARQTGFGERFLNPDGEHSGQFRFPVGKLVVFPNLTREQLEQPGDGGGSLAALFPDQHTATRDELDAWEDLDPEALLGELWKCMTPGWPIAPLSEDEVNALRAIINPEISFDHQVSLERLGQQPEPVREQSGVVVELDQQQEEVANAVGGGHRVVYGVAGSGKTLLLLARARRLLEADPGAQVLLTCYNRTLASWLAHELAGCPGVTVRNFHRWAADNGTPFDPESDDASFGEALLESLQNGAGDAGQFDAVLVDEAQDFEPNWFRCLLAAMKDPERGDLLIVADGTQGLYRRSGVSWSQLGIKAQGRTSSIQFDLDRNYRNPTEVITLAETFASSDDRAPGERSGGMESVRVGSANCIRSTGASPLVTLANNREDELANAELLIRGLLNGQWDGRPIAPIAPSEIAVLYPAATEDEKVLLSVFAERLADDGVPVAWLTQPSVYHPQDRVTTSGVKLQTIHSSKGLQYRAVIVVFTDKLPRYINRNVPAARLADRRLLYVAMTRAESFLALSASRPSEFFDDLSDSPAAHRVDTREPGSGEISATA